MSKKVAIDAGHGLYTKGKRTPDDEREWSFNDKVVDATISELSKYDVEILRTDDATGATDVSLPSRVNKANAFDADAFVSVHHNANTGEWGNWGGVETYTHNNSSSEAEKLAKDIHGRVVKAYGLKDRGLKKANHAVTRGTKMPAILLEGGFMDSKTDIKKMRSDAVLKNVGVAVAEGIASFLNLKKKPVKEQDKIETPFSTTYTIKSGDTLWGISQATGVSVDNLKKYNNLTSDNIAVGQPLVLTDSLSLGAKTKAGDAESVKPKYVLPTGTLRKGDRGSEVTQLQKALVAVNFYPDKDAKNDGVDGIYGKDTFDAVERFQSVHVGDVDGVYGEQTRTVLNKLLNK